jgi:pyridoxamine 5'-phosphate oxidase
MSPAEMRTEYTLAGLYEADAGDDPIELFGRWFHDALKAGLPEPTAMTLATATPDGRPSARIALLKAFDHGGFTFFTNYNSRKARELAANPHGALLLHWIQLQRQVRIEGTTTKVTSKVSDNYFANRPRGSKLGAWASPQSEVVPDRITLDRRLAELEDQYPGDDVPRPPNWGGYLLSPEIIEFWQGRPNRMHDRLRFTRQTDRTWKRERLAP